MPDSIPDELLHLLVRRPPDVNPFLMMANVMESSLKPGVMPPWARWINRCILIGFFLMWIQASRLLYIRIQTKSIHSFSFNRLGLLRIDLLSLYVVGLWVYSMLTIVSMIFHEAITLGLHDHSGEIMLFGTKFLVLAVCVLFVGLLWVCVVQATLLVLDSSRGKKQLPSAVRWAMNVIFIILSLFPIPGVIATYAKANSAYISILQTVKPVIQQLKEASVSYSPQKYTPSQVFKIIISARPATHQLDILVQNIRRGIFIYASVLGFATVLYIPLLIVLMKKLFKARIRNDSHMCSSGIPSSEVSKSPLKKSQASKMRKMLVYHLVFTVTSIFTHLPVLIWQLLHTKIDFYRNQNWIVATRLGLHGPFCVAGNLILLIQNLDIGLWLEKDELPCSAEILDASQFSSTQQGSHLRLDTVGSSDPPKEYSQSSKV